MSKKSRGTRLWDNAITRRLFVKQAGLSVAAAATGLSAANARASELPKVDEGDAMAKSLNYVHDATSVDSAIRPSDRFCYNCALYQGDKDAEWAGCSIFPGKAVAGKGWCSVWAPKQS
ncbi:MAG: high-potential iron-sulfur protein [Woeseiaceae bacterium]|nr:high-potential iron-sulfur protein [Woeseiaceae bacterium]